MVIIPPVNVLSIVPVGVVMGGPPETLVLRRGRVRSDNAGADTIIFQALRSQHPCYNSGGSLRPWLSVSLNLFSVRGPAAKLDYISLNPIKPGYARLPPELRSREGVAALN